MGGYLYEVDWDLLCDGISWLVRVLVNAVFGTVPVGYEYLSKKETRDCSVCCNAHDD